MKSATIKLDGKALENFERVENHVQSLVPGSTRKLTAGEVLAFALHETAKSMPTQASMSEVA